MKDEIIFLNITKRKQNRIKGKKGKIRIRKEGRSKEGRKKGRKERRKTNMTIKKEGKKAK